MSKENNNDNKEVDNFIYDLTNKKMKVLNAPIGANNTSYPATYLSFSKKVKDQSVEEGLSDAQGIPYYDENGAVNPNSAPTTLDMMLEMYRTISDPVAFMSMGILPQWDQSVVDNNGGYAKGCVVYLKETGGTYADTFNTEMISLVDNNQEKPTKASLKWGLSYKVGSAGIYVTRLFDIYSNNYCCKFERNNQGAYVLHLMHGFVIARFYVSATSQGDNFTYKELVGLEFNDSSLMHPIIFGLSGNTAQADISTANPGGFYIKTKEGTGLFGVLVIGQLIGYVGDILGKIRNYKNTPYHKNLTKEQQDELDNYYIQLDKEKDNSKVTAPDWWESEITGKNLD